MTVEVKSYRWSPFLVLDTGPHELKIRRGDSITVLKEASNATALSRMLEFGWFDVPEFAISNPAILPDDVKHVLAKLVENSILREVDRDEAIPPVAVEFCARSGYQLEESSATRRIRSISLFLTGDEATLLKLLSKAFHEIGIETTTVETLDTELLSDLRNTGTDESVENVVVAAYQDLFSEDSLEQNRLLVNESIPGRTLFLGGFDGRRSIVGPWVIPGKSACLNCWTTRRRANLVNIPESLRPGSVDGENIISHHRTRAQLSSIDRLIAVFAADLVSEYIVLGAYASSSRPGSYRVVESSRNGIIFETHHLLRLPRCEVCSQSRSTGYPQVWHHG